MPETFDPYYKWLGIPPADQPPNHYRLLGIPLFESDRDVIANAADQRMGHIRAFQTGEHSALSQEILNEISAARVCLLNAEKKTQYDAALQRGEAAKKLPKATALETPPLQPPPVETDNELDLESLASSAVTHHPHPRRRKKAPWRAWAIAGAAVVALVVISVFFLVSGHRETEIAGSRQASKSKLEATVATKKPKEESKAEPEPKAKAKQEAEVAQPVNQESEPEKTKPDAEKPSSPPETSEEAEARLKKALADATSVEDYRAVARDGLKAFERAVAGGHTDLSKRMATMALVAARKAKDDELAEDAAFCFLSGCRQPLGVEQEEQPAKGEGAFASPAPEENADGGSVGTHPPLAATPLNERTLKWISQDATYVASSIYDGEGRRHPPLPSLLTDNGPRHFDDQFAFETKHGRDPYIIIKLRRVWTIHSFYIQNRTVQCLERAAGLTMWMSLDGRRWKKVWIAAQPKAEWNEPLDSPVRAMYVRLGLEGEDRALHLRTVKLFGYKTGQAPKAATKMPKAAAPIPFPSGAPMPEAEAKTEATDQAAETRKPQRQSTPKADGETWLDELSPLQHKQGHGSLGINRSVDNNPLKIGGQTYSHGLGTHSNAMTVYALGGRYRQFEAECGVDSEVGEHGSCTFQVWADGKKLFDSGMMRGGEPAKKVAVDLRRKAQLVLIVTDAGDGMSNDHADWANARLVGKRLASQVGIGHDKDEQAATFQASTKESTDDLKTPGKSKTTAVRATWLDDLAETDVHVGVGQLGKHGAGRYGGKCQLHGTDIPHSLCTYPPEKGTAYVTYKLDGSYRTFKAMVALVDTGNPPTPLTFRVLGDGKLLWQSPPLQKMGKTQPCTVGIRKVRVLSLQVVCPGYNGWAEALWVAPQLSK